MPDSTRGSANAAMGGPEALVSLCLWLSSQARMKSNKHDRSAYDGSGWQHAERCSFPVVRLCARRGAGWHGHCRVRVSTSVARRSRFNGNGHGAVSHIRGSNWSGTSCTIQNEGTWGRGWDRFNGSNVDVCAVPSTWRIRLDMKARARRHKRNAWRAPSAEPTDAKDSRASSWLISGPWAASL